MGEKNFALKAYLSVNMVFADIFNLVFGEYGFWVDPEKLQDMDSVHILSVPLKKEVKDRRGDVKMAAYRERLHDAVKVLELPDEKGSSIFMLGIEGQSALCPCMPMRILQYEDQMLTFAMERIVEKHLENEAVEPERDYLSGWSEKDILPFVLTIVLYMGVDEWSRYYGLTDMQRQEPLGKLSERMLEIRLNILTLKEITKKDPDRFFSDIGVVAAYIVYEKEPDKLKAFLEACAKCRRVSRKAINVINAYTKLAITIPENEEVVDMHYAEQVWQQQSEERGIKIGEERGIKIGEERGIKIGEERGIKIGEERGEEKERRKSIRFFIQGCRNLGIDKEDIAKQLMDMYQLSHDDAMEKVHDVFS
ncbi:MAG: hypothetical protein K5787_03160 [Lentisphaeria bacterium]|nr:hypothetical protein [Lentisphaeria bacterium]